MAKTLPTEIDVGTFLDAVEPKRKRQEAFRLDALFREATGEEPVMWGPSIIGYGEYETTYESGRHVRWLRTGFSPRKARHSLYLMGGYCDEAQAERRDALFARLGKYKTGKSCLYINKLADVDMDMLRDLVATDWDTMMRLYPPSE